MNRNIIAACLAAVLLLGCDCVKMRFGRCEGGKSNQTIKAMKMVGQMDRAVLNGDYEKYGSFFGRYRRKPGGGIKRAFDTLVRAPRLAERSSITLTGGETGEDGPFSCTVSTDFYAGYIVSYYFGDDSGKLSALGVSIKRDGEYKKGTAKLQDKDSRQGILGGRKSEKGRCGY